MGFRIRVTASGGFRYLRSNQEHGSDLELNLIQKLILKRVGLASSASGSATIRLAHTTAKEIFIPLLIQNIKHIMASYGQGRLHIHINHSHTLWPDSGGGLSITLAGQNEHKVTRALFQFLDRHNMNTGGVTRAITDALAEFVLKYEGKAGYLIIIELSD